MKIESLYGLSCLEVPVQMLGGTTESAVWQLSTNRGNWLIKVFGDSKRLSKRVPDEANLYGYLNKHGIRAPKVLFSKRLQRSEEIEIGTHTYPIIIMELEDLRFAQAASIQDHELLEIARTIARMHQCLQHYKGPLGKAAFHNSSAGRVCASLLTSVRGVIRKYRNLMAIPRWGDTMVGRKPEGYDLLVSSPNASAFTAEELSRFLILDKEMKAFLTADPRSSHLTKSIIHRDLRLEHLPFLANGDVYIFDFAGRGFGAISQDLAGMLYELYVSEEITYDRWKGLRELFLAGYRSVVDLTMIDLNAISLFLMSSILWRISHLSKRSNEMQRIVKSEVIRQHYQFADYLLKSGVK